MSCGIFSNTKSSMSQRAKQTTTDTVSQRPRLLYAPPLCAEEPHSCISHFGIRVSFKPATRSSTEFLRREDTLSKNVYRRCRSSMLMQAFSHSQYTLGQTQRPEATPSHPVGQNHAESVLLLVLLLLLWLLILLMLFYSERSLGISSQETAGAHCHCDIAGSGPGY